MHIQEIEVGCLYFTEHLVGMNVDAKGYFSHADYDFFLVAGDIVMVVGIEHATCTNLLTVIKLLGKYGIMIDVAINWESRFSALKIQ